MRCVADVKYFSKGSLLIVMAPWPGRKRTRATACLRRPVVWLSGVGIAVWRPSWCAWSAGAAGRRQVERLGLLGGVGMVGPGVDLQLGEHLAAEGVLGQHAAHGAADQLGRLLVEQLRVAGGAQSAGVTAVAVGHLRVGLARGEDDLVRVD